MVQVAHDRNVLISIKDIYVKKIQTGEKRVELRKRFPRVVKGTRVYVYVTAPVKQVVGFFVVQKIQELSIDSLWETDGWISSLSRDEFSAYFIGKKRGVSIHFRRLVPLFKAISLSNIREIYPEFHPPQSFIYLSVGLEQLLLGTQTFTNQANSISIPFQETAVS